MRFASNVGKLPIHVIYGASAGAILSSPLPGILFDLNKEDFVEQFFGAGIAWFLVAFLIGVIVGWVIKITLRSRIVYASRPLLRALLIVTCSACIFGIVAGSLKSSEGKLRAHEEHVASVAAAQAVAQKYQADARASQAREAAKLKDEVDRERSRFAQLTPAQQETERVAQLHGVACKAVLAEYAKCEAMCGDRYVSCMANLHAPENCGGAISLKSMYDHSSCK